MSVFCLEGYGAKKSSTHLKSPHIVFTTKSGTAGMSGNGFITALRTSKKVIIWINR